MVAQDLLSGTHYEIHVASTRGVQRRYMKINHRSTYSVYQHVYTFFVLFLFPF
jgi:hypothetical protein